MSEADFYLLDRSHPNSANKWGSLLQFNDGTGTECCKIGRRIPVLWLNENPNTLTIASGIGENWNYHEDIDGIPSRKWFRLTLSQFKIGVIDRVKLQLIIFDQFCFLKGSYYFEAKVDGRKKMSVRNTSPRTFYNIKVFGCVVEHSNHLIADALIKNLNTISKP